MIAALAYITMLIYINNSTYIQLSDPKVPWHFPDSPPDPYTVTVSDNTDLFCPITNTSSDEKKDYAMMGWVQIQEFPERGSYGIWLILDDGGRHIPSLMVDSITGIFMSTVFRGSLTSHIKSPSYNIVTPQWFHVTQIACLSGLYLGIWIGGFNSAVNCTIDSFDDGDINVFGQKASFVYGSLGDGYEDFMGQILDLQYHVGQCFNQDTVVSIMEPNRRCASVCSDACWGPGNYSWNDFIQFANQQNPTVLTGSYKNYKGQHSFLQGKDLNSVDISITGWSKRTDFTGGWNDIFRAHWSDTDTIPTDNLDNGSFVPKFRMGQEGNLRYKHRSVNSDESFENAEVQIKVLQENVQDWIFWGAVTFGSSNPRELVVCWTTINILGITCNTSEFYGEVESFTTDHNTTYIGLGSRHKGFTGSFRDVRYYFDTAISEDQILDISQETGRCITHWTTCLDYDTCQLWDENFTIVAGKCEPCGFTCSNAGAFNYQCSCDVSKNLIEGYCVDKWPTDEYYNESTDSCQTWACDPDCLTWVVGSGSSWITCQESNALPSPASGGKWYCQAGYYTSQESPLVCYKCHDACIECTGPDICVTWHENAILIGGSWTCVEGYYSDPDEANWTAWAADWLTCNEALKWLTCRDIDKIVDEAGLCIYTPWELGQYRQSSLWYSWASLCTSCTSEVQCVECISNATLNENSLCVCSVGYIQTESGCEVYVAGPLPTISVSLENNVQIVLDKPLSRQITKSDIRNFEIYGSRPGGYTFTWALIESIPYVSYVIEIIFDPPDIPAETQYSLTLNESLADQLGNPIQQSHFSGQFFAVEIESDEDRSNLEKEEADKLRTATSTTSKSATALAFVLGAITGDFSPIWNMINTLQLVAFIPLMSTNIPIRLAEVLKSFLEFGLVPNVFEYAMDESEFLGPQPYTLAQDFGFEYSVFLINAGETISQILIPIVLFPILFALSWYPNNSMSNWAKHNLIQYKWCVFLRVWIEIYLEVTVAAFVQVLEPAYDNITLGFNTILGYIFIVLVSCSPILFLLFYITQSSKIKSMDDDCVIKYGTLFTEFKNARGIAM